jgi:hypothetical protein
MRATSTRYSASRRRTWLRMASGVAMEFLQQYYQKTL